jgi:hypothetical protein
LAFCEDLPSFNPKWGSETYMQQCMAYLLFQLLDS